MKRLLQSNTGRNGSVNTDNVAKALLQYRTPPPPLCEINLSSAELALGRPLRDSIPLPPVRYRINPKWALHLRQREIQMSRANEHIKEKYDLHSRLLLELNIAENVICQNTQTKAWDRSGTIVSQLAYRQYMVKMDGSGLTSLCNRRHLKELIVNKPHTPIIKPIINVGSEGEPKLCPECRTNIKCT